MRWWQPNCADKLAQLRAALAAATARAEAAEAENARLRAVVEAVRAMYDAMPCECDGAECVALRTAIDAL